LFLLVWNLDSALSGYRLSYARVGLNTAVILAVLFKFRHTRILIKVWALLPFISVGLYLLSSLLRGSWNAYPIEHGVGAALALPVLLWLNKAFSKSAEQI
jgi:hypothetical protein